ncbi:hypothetical protein [Baaleninema simplex]|uniref:hypothetical protein n=1 Tax=Baaleninema simplex TaxID=2862350 RepID=UPI000349B759|nr:hypothetical protein [Baaleninema simplex]
MRLFRSITGRSRVSCSRFFGSNAPSKTAQPLEASRDRRRCLAIDALASSFLRSL